MISQIKTLSFAVVGCVMAVSAAVATPMTQSFTVDFKSPSEAIWGPGKAAASFNYDKYVIGNSTFGVRFQAGASTGTVTSRYNGSIQVGYDDLVYAGLTNLSFVYTGDASGGAFSTSFGAWAKATAYLPVAGAVTITNPNYSLNTGRTYTPSPPDNYFDDDSFTPASTAVGPDVGVGAAQAGVDYDITQNSRHVIGALTGMVLATHQGDGVTRTGSLSFGSTDIVGLNLDLAGIWDISLIDLSLANTFYTDFDLDIVPFAEYYLGFNCGDTGTDDDNGFGCVGDGRLDANLASIDLFSNNPFSLDMRLQNTLSSFQIEVMEKSVVGDRTSVPEPATLALFGLGLTGLGFVRRRKAA